MKKCFIKYLLFSILLLFTTISNAQEYSKKSMTLRFDAGLTLPHIQTCMGFYYYNTSKIFNPIAGIIYTGWDVNKTGRYEDYTSVFGTVNIFDDREDGDVYKEKWDGYGLASRVKIAKGDLIIGYGLCWYERKFYQALYDPSEILGNNGYYYIDSPKHKEKITCFWYQIKYNTNVYKFSGGNILIGLGIISNPIPHYENYRIKLDIGIQGELPLSS